MIINDANLSAIHTGFKGSWNGGFAGVESQWAKVAMRTTSGTAQETYSWLGQFPRMREWLGDRVINNLTAEGWTIANRTFEQTIAVPRTKIEDDQYGVYAPMFAEMGKDAAEQPDRLVFELMAQGFDKPCYDGQRFYDADHPVLDSAGVEHSVSNVEEGDGPAWYLLDMSRPLKPLIYQERVAPTFTSVDNERDETVFWKDEYVYGVRYRANAGLGFWQLIFASKGPLTAESYEAARKRMTAMRGDYGRLLGIKPTTLVVPSELEGEGRDVLVSDRLPDGGSNKWIGSADLVVTPWLDSEGAFFAPPAPAPAA